MMSEGEKLASIRKRWSLPARLYLLGAFILAAGWIAGILIFVTAGAEEPGGDLAYGTGWERRYAFQLERIGGKAAVMADELTQWFSALWHGRRLAFTMAFLCTGLALLCFLIARGVSVWTASDQPEQPGDRDS